MIRIESIVILSISDELICKVLRTAWTVQTVHYSFFKNIIGYLFLNSMIMNFTLGKAKILQWKQANLFTIECSTYFIALCHA